MATPLESAAVENASNSPNTIIYLQDHSSVAFKGNSTIIFGRNAVVEGIIYSQLYGNIIFDENSSVLFTLNLHLQGYTIYLKDHSKATYKGNSKAMFSNNIFEFQEGQTLYVYNHSSVTFEENTEVSFIHNEVHHGDGGAIYCEFHSSIMFTGYSTVTFRENRAVSAGALSSHTNSIIVFNENTRVAFMHNVAKFNGGAMALSDNANFVFKGNSNVSFDNNTALNLGGAYACHSAITFIENATVHFVENKAELGGAIALTLNYNVTFGKAQVTFSNNTANYGAAIWMNVTDTRGKINFDMQRVGAINFYNNTALVLGNSIFMDIKCTLNKSFFTEKLLGITNCNISQLDKQQDGLKKHISTSPYNIVLQDMEGKPLICHELHNVTCDCKSYYLNDVMLGHEVFMKGLVHDYINNSIPLETSFEIHNVKLNTNYRIQFVNQNSFQGFGIIITGNKTISNYNYSLNVTSLYTIPHQKTISVSLTIQLSPCYLGFQHNHESMKCECYDREDVVRCDGIISNIRRGYWLGTVENKVTATICPINFCDFTCCETSNGYHSLSPDREDQCTSHRSGVACGSCEEGYSLSYGADCVSVDKCTAGWIILVVTLTMLYWIVIVIGAFAMMHYKLPVGYLYALTYYYSIVDVFLGQHLYLYPSLHTATNILSSVFKLSPQFLGKLCLAKGLSGIDVYFIHYIHPLVVLLILVKIVLLARYSQRLSSFISKGIIRVICFLLLISYTSIVTISLLLIRSLTFYDVDKTYTYLSPEIEYLQGRHLVYFIVAVICIITVVIGLPLILLLEPFLNSKINFTRIKPLLDQFQGCFKDQYRWFASYYMVCRLVQITIVVYSSDFFITQYILIVTSVITSLLHVVIRPYSKKTLNTLDGIVLHLLTLVAVIPVFDSFNSTTIIPITFILVFLPSLFFFIMGFSMHKEVIRRSFAMICRPKNTHSEHVVKEENENKKSMQEFGMIIDESMRKNATICDV